MDKCPGCRAQRRSKDCICTSNFVLKSYYFTERSITITLNTLLLCVLSNYLAAMWTSIPMSKCFMKALVASTMFHFSVSALDIKTVFKVAPGESKVDGCDANINDLGKIFQEAFDMAKSGLDTANSLLQRQGTYSDVYFFSMLYGINMAKFRSGTDMDEVDKDTIYPLITGL